MAEVDAAIKLLVDLHWRYTLLILGQDVRELYPEDDYFDILDALEENLATTDFSLRDIDDPRHRATIAPSSLRER